MKRDDLDRLRQLLNHLPFSSKEDRAFLYQTINALEVENHNLRVAMAEVKFKLAESLDIAEKALPTVIG